MSDPIRIPCEGSNRIGHAYLGTSKVALCKMCGELRPAHRRPEFYALVVDEHDRDDILAMIERGDYG